jgi:hypothetical protein
MPSQLRRMLRNQGRDLHQQFISFLPYQLPTVKIQRWSMRRVTLSIAVIVGVVLVATLAIPLIVNSPL